jgi:hypothetical protein
LVVGTWGHKPSVHNVSDSVCVLDSFSPFSSPHKVNAIPTQVALDLDTREEREHPLQLGS